MSAAINLVQPAVTDRSPTNRPMSHLTLSLFPGIDLLGRGFEAEGFPVVRGPDPLFGGDIRSFHVPAGRFDGVIGGPPCPDFSKARRGSPPTGYGLEMIGEYIRLVEEAKPLWWLMENVPGVPDVKIPGYSHQRLDINSRELGSKQNRHRHFQYGHSQGHVISIPRLPKSMEWEPCCIASEGRRTNKRDWNQFCRLQGLSDGIDLDNLTLSARYRAVGNGVPIYMAQALARAILDAKPPSEVRICGCGCGREIGGRAQYAVPACRKRMQRRRDTKDGNQVTSRKTE
ncbi:DNA cytosine methyltransferase [Methylomonas rosea]|uniref:DNA cytosine methyltransferase n=1 Tax=Methylomonas rosea TaxID=2952227 RepID=A0ABT1TVK1_9GAMM|nr:DNA cytosine methyltransferase [Methylomonas sp. WSC-7]MCQ8118502.1 DNA cytosine methyltransferase [Methylomonas sp. WSC-7]